MTIVKKGNKVKVEYVGTLEDGTVFDSSEKHGQPLEFEAGSGQLIKGFDNAVNLILVAITIFILAIAISALLMLRGR